MRDLTKKRRVTRTLYSPLSLAALLVVTILFGSAAWSAYEKQSDTKLRRVEATAELARLSAREEILKEDLARLETREGVEAEVRERFDVGRSGEKIIVIVEPPESLATSTAPSRGKWWQKLWPW